MIFVIVLSQLFEIFPRKLLLKKTNKLALVLKTYSFVKESDLSALGGN